MGVIETDRKYVADTYARQNVVFVRGKGATLVDRWGNKYIDFGAGIAVNGLGIGFGKWRRAVRSQLKALPHASNLYYTQPCADLAKLLCRRTGMKKVFFSNSGAEANECAIKTARKYSFDKYGENRFKIVTLVNSFHGRTLTTLSATGQEGGVYVLDKEYVKKAEELCRKKDVLLIVDEVQTGNGRTGSLYAYMQYGISPDIVTTAKGLGNGLPIGATMFSAKCEKTLTPGTHGSTFGGNPVACAGAIAVIKAINDKLLSGVAEKGERIRGVLSVCSKVKSVSGLGLMLGVEADDAAALKEQCLQKGLVVLTAKDKLRLLPPLNIGDDELEEGLRILKEVLG